MLQGSEDVGIRALEQLASRHIGFYVQAIGNLDSVGSIVAVVGHASGAG